MTTQVCHTIANPLPSLISLFSWRLAKAVLHFFHGCHLSHNSVCEVTSSNLRSFSLHLYLNTLSAHEKKLGISRWSDLHASNDLSWSYRVFWTHSKIFYHSKRIYHFYLFLTIRLTNGGILNILYIAHWEKRHKSKFVGFQERQF